MRFVLALTLTILLAACGGSPAPTSTPESQPTPETATTAEVSEVNPFGNLPATPAALPGTLVPASGATIESPNAEPFRFDNLVFTQTGGLSGVDVRVELRSDGTLIRNGETTTVSAEEVQRITDMLAAINFYRFEGIFVGSGAAPDAYRYTLTVNGPLGSRTVTAEDGLTPMELLFIFDSIRSLGE